MSGTVAAAAAWRLYVNDVARAQDTLTVVELREAVAAYRAELNARLAPVSNHPITDIIDDIVGAVTEAFNSGWDFSMRAKDAHLSARVQIIREDQRLLANRARDRFAHLLSAEARS